MDVLSSSSRPRLDRDIRCGRTRIAQSRCAGLRARGHDGDRTLRSAAVAGWSAPDNDGQLHSPHKFQLPRLLPRDSARGAALLCGSSRTSRLVLGRQRPRGWRQLLYRLLIGPEPVTRVINDTLSDGAFLAAILLLGSVVQGRRIQAADAADRLHRAKAESERVAQELQVARLVQHQFLPAPPTFPAGNLPPSIDRRVRSVGISTPLSSWPPERWASPSATSPTRARRPPS